MKKEYATTMLVQVLKRLFGMATCVAHGGGGTCLNAPKAFFKGCKTPKNCYNSDTEYHNYNRGNMKKYGFTLAEVLVTLGIIGVVSAMTVPSLMQNYQRQSYVTQLHKVYNETSQALMQFQNDKNALNLTEAGLNTQADLDNFIKNYFKVVQKCDGALTPCFYNLYKTINGGTPSFGVGTSHVLASGASIRLLSSVDGEKIANLAIDINGQKGPNLLGRDFFFFAIYKNGVIDDFSGAAVPLTEAQRQTLFTNNCMSAANVSGWGCFGKILNDNWQMTY